MCRVIVLISRQLRGTARSRALNKNLISGYLSLILAVALNALKAVSSFIMLVDHQQVIGGHDVKEWTETSSLAASVLKSLSHSVHSKWCCEL